MPSSEELYDYLSSQDINGFDPKIHTKEEFKHLKRFIEIVAGIYFPQIKNLGITIVNDCDYNDCNSLFETVSKKVKEIDTNDNKLYFNITPGTVVVSSTLTLFSLDATRSLCYYPQIEKPEITLIDKSKLPLENLLSEAMENIKS